jgi:hypothetical protein
LQKRLFTAEGKPDLSGEKANFDARLNCTTRQAHFTGFC